MIPVAPMIAIVLALAPVVFFVGWAWGRRAQREDTVRMLSGLMGLSRHELPASLDPNEPIERRSSLSTILASLAVCVRQRYDRLVIDRENRRGVS